jgi:hypothetical protein
MASGWTTSGSRNSALLAVPAATSLAAGMLFGWQRA